MEVLKGYDYTILYHTGKANIVADALSRKSIGSLAYIALKKRPLIEDIYKLETKGVQFELGSSGMLLAHTRAQSTLIDRIKVAQWEDPRLVKLKEDVSSGRTFEFALDQEGVLPCGDYLYVPNTEGLR